MKELKIFCSNLFQSIITSRFIYGLVIKNTITDHFVQYRNLGYISVLGQSIYLQSLIYFGFYERKECKVIAKYLRTDLDVIELGASLGAATLAICKKTNKRIFSVEANQKLIENLNRTKEKNNLNNLFFYNRALSYSADLVEFFIDPNNLGSKKSVNTGEFIKSITLEKIIEENSIGEYIIVSDIEGAEIEFVVKLSDTIIIKNCKQIIIELHDTEFDSIHYSKSQIAELIKVNFSMNITYSDKLIWVFEKK